jgi:hypothetical protein
MRRVLVPTLLVLAALAPSGTARAQAKPTAGKDIAKEHGGGYGLGIIYAKEMFGAEEGK